mmetsp:Transcript_53593/g.160400  ORF Transcript_53593/g.160400 Transcript_53593/m.160400 type:complete len:281 (+) Transcript_53593:3609-4451(+)
MQMHALNRRNEVKGRTWLAVEVMPLDSPTRKEAEPGSYYDRDDSSAGSSELTTPIAVEPCEAIETEIDIDPSYSDGVLWAQGRKTIVRCVKLESPDGGRGYDLDCAISNPKDEPKAVPVASQGNSLDGLASDLFSGAIQDVFQMGVMQYVQQLPSSDSVLSASSDVVRSSAENIAEVNEISMEVLKWNGLRPLSPMAYGGGIGRKRPRSGGMICDDPSKEISANENGRAMVCVKNYFTLTDFPTDSILSHMCIILTIEAFLLHCPCSIWWNASTTIHVHA